MIMRWVIDTSVVVKWLAGENELLLEQAGKVFYDMTEGGIECFAPDLIIYELANTLLLSKKLPIDEAQLKSRELFEFNLKIIRVDILLIQDAIRLAHQYGITVYDATFVATAYQHHAGLITSNPKHHGKIKDGTVLLLKDYPM